MLQITHTTEVFFAWWIATRGRNLQDMHWDQEKNGIFWMWEELLASIVLGRDVAGPGLTELYQPDRVPGTARSSWTVSRSRVVSWDPSEQREAKAEEERNFRGVPLSARPLGYQLAGQISLYSSRQAQTEAVFLLYRWRIWDSISLRPRNEIKSGRAKVWRCLESLHSFHWDTLLQLAECFPFHGWGLPHVAFPELPLTSLLYSSPCRGGGTSVTELSVQQASLRRGRRAWRGRGLSSGPHEYSHGFTHNV